MNGKGIVIQYIDDIINVVADGNCGYHVILSYVGQGEQDWSLIRIQCYQEMLSRQWLYIDMFGSANFNLIINSILVDTITGTQPLCKWMTVDVMGYVIATLYQRPRVLVSKLGSATFFPLFGIPTSQDLMGIAFIQKCHFVK